MSNKPSTFKNKKKRSGKKHNFKMSLLTWPKKILKTMGRLLGSKN